MGGSIIRVTTTQLETGDIGRRLRTYKSWGIVKIITQGQFDDEVVEARASRPELKILLKRVSVIFLPLAMRDVGNSGKA